MQRADLVILERLGERLLSAFGRLITALPPHARGISGMSRHLGVHKATCQRVVEAVTKCDQGLSAFVRLPGIAALRALLAACRRRAVDPARIETCEAAVDRWDAEMSARSVSQRGLVDLISALRDAPGAAAADLTERRALEQRRALYTAARKLTGEDVETKIGIGIIEPIAGVAAPRRFRVTAVVALLGVRRSAFARPIAPFVISGSHDPLPLGSPKRAMRATPSFQLLHEFSTAGLHAVRLAESNARTLLVVDTDGAPGGDGAPVDVAVMFSSEMTLPANVRLSAAARIVQPTRTLIHDVYIRTALAARAHPTVACLALTATPGDQPGGGPDECWHDRFPESVKPDPLRIPTINTASAPPRPSARRLPIDQLAAALAARAFSDRGIDPARLKGWRTRVAYPVWQSEYRFHL